MIRFVVGAARGDEVEIEVDGADHPAKLCDAALGWPSRLLGEDEDGDVQPGVW